MNVHYLNDSLITFAVGTFRIDGPADVPREAKRAQVKNLDNGRVIFEGTVAEYRRWKRLRALCNENEIIEAMELTDRELWPLFVCTPYLRTWLCNQLSDSETQVIGRTSTIADAEYIFSTMPDRAKKSIIGDVA